MASGDLVPLKESDLPLGFVITSSGRISGVTQPGDVSLHYPFPTMDLVTLRDWLVAMGVTLVGMESTGVYWKPVFYVLEPTPPNKAPLKASP